MEDLEPNGWHWQQFILEARAIIAADPWTAENLGRKGREEAYQRIIREKEAQVERLRGAITKAVKRANGNGMGDWKEFTELNKAISDPGANAPT